MSADVAQVREKVMERNWLYRELSITHFVKSGQITDGEYSPSVVIPIGSIEFCEEALSLFAGSDTKMKPYRFTENLMNPSAIGRKAAYCTSKEKVAATFDEWGVTDIFIKSAVKLKCDYADFYQKGIAERSLPDDSEYFVSEWLPIISEWRTFVHRGKIIDIRCYSGDPWIIPAKDSVEAILSAVLEYGEPLNAFTLDVAVTEDGVTVLMEIHNFVACGLYGFSRPEILPMLAAAWTTEKAKSTIVQGK
jgi:hypothetical protein